MPTSPPTVSPRITDEFGEIRNILQRADEGHRPLRPPFSTDWGHPSRGVRLVRELKSENEYDPA